MDDSGFDSDHKQRQSQEDDRLFAVSGNLYQEFIKCRCMNKCI